MTLLDSLWEPLNSLPAGSLVILWIIGTVLLELGVYWILESRLRIVVDL